jgi:hypothetical protein
MGGLGGLGWVLLEQFLISTTTKVKQLTRVTKLTSFKAILREN